MLCSLRRGNQLPAMRLISTHRSIANERVLRDQLLCAASEAPLSGDDRARFVGGRDGSVPEESGRIYDRALDSLRRDGSLVERSKALCCRRSDTKHAKNVPLRVVDPVTIEVRINGVVLDTVPYARAFYELFEGAIYLHQAPGRRPFVFATSPRHRRDVVSFLESARWRGGRRRGLRHAIAAT